MFRSASYGVPATNPFLEVRYDTSSRVDSITTPGGRVTKVTYDALGRVASVIQTTDAAHTTGPTTTFSYTPGAPCATGDTKTVVSDPLATGSNGHTTTHCADTRGAVKKTVDSAGNTTSRTYDPKANLTSVTRPGGGVTNIGWDSTTQNLLCVQRGSTSVQSCQTATGGLKTTTFAYANTDPLTKFFPTTVTRPRNSSLANTGTTVCYNGSTPACGTNSGPAGSVQSVTNQLPSQNVRRYSYNAKGNLTAATDARGFTTGYGYDGGATTSHRSSPQPGRG